MNRTRRRRRWVCVACLLVPVLLISGCRKSSGARDGGFEINLGPDLGPEIEIPWGGGDSDEGSIPDPSSVSESTPDPSTDESTPVPDDATEETFQSVQVGSCLPIWRTGHGSEWSHDEPPAPVSCTASEGGLFEVVSVGSSSAECDSSPGYDWWSYTSSVSGETTTLCLNRVWVPGYCVLAEGDNDGDVATFGTTTAVDCDASSIPVEYDYVLVVSDVYQAPADPSSAYCMRSSSDPHPYWTLVVDNGATMVCFTEPA